MWNNFRNEYLTMKHDTQDNQRLAKFVDKLCKKQPLRTAPTTLQARVMRELQLRAALPWWRRSFVNWTVSLQVLFVVAALLAAKLMLLIGDWASVHWVSSAVAATKSSSLVSGMGAMLTITRHVSEQLFDMVPISFVYGVVLVIAALYLVLFGIGVTTYKTLYAAR
jgi:hypothetical protein